MKLKTVCRVLGYSEQRVSKLVDLKMLKTRGGIIYLISTLTTFSERPRTLGILDPLGWFKNFGNPGACFDFCVKNFNPCSTRPVNRVFLIRSIPVIANGTASQSRGRIYQQAINIKLTMVRCVGFGLKPPR